MWCPESWEDLVALLGVAEESSSLDFKRDYPSNPAEIAKDVAAMAANGGVLIYGIGEDKEAALAAAPHPFAVKGAEERLRTIVGTRIAPPVAIDVTVIRHPSDSTHGVLAISVPASANAPHQVDGRFPVRNGTTTRNLTEPEVERLYRQRWALGAGTPSATEILDDFELPRGVKPAQAEMLTHWVGRARVVVANAAHAGANHPEYPDYYGALTRARTAAQEWTDRCLSTGQPKELLRQLHSWRPYETIGWAAGEVVVPGDGTDVEARYGAVVAYPATFSFWLSWPLRIGSDPGYCCAHEWQIAAELMTVLVLAGRFLTETEGAGPVSCAVDLSGFDEAVAAQATHERPDVFVGGMPSAPASHVEAVLTTAAALASDAPSIARELLARWLIAFYQGTDLIETITR